MLDKYKIAPKLWHSIVPSIIMIPFVSLLLHSYNIQSKRDNTAYIYMIVMAFFAIFSVPLSKMSRQKSFIIGVIGSVLISLIIQLYF